MVCGVWSVVYSVWCVVCARCRVAYLLLYCVVLYGMVWYCIVLYSLVLYGVV